jgi:hypothetical protein
MRIRHSWCFSTVSAPYAADHFNATVCCLIGAWDFFTHQRIGATELDPAGIQAWLDGSPPTGSTSKPPGAS